MLWYGMSGQRIKQIKRDIEKGVLSADDIKEKHGISDFQLEMICKWKLKRDISSIKKRVEKLEKAVFSEEIRVGTTVYCKDANFGNGQVVEVDSTGDTGAIKFEGREFPTHADFKKRTVSPDGIVRKFKITRY